MDLRKREAQEYLGYNNSDNEENRVLAADVVFLVDNSGSMGEEANAIARDIIDWAEKLAASSLDVRFGCVGYDGGINGVLNITTIEDLNEYLSRYPGTSRTSYFGGDDASTLSSASYSYRTGGECGMAALRFADKQFSFRTGANRIYVNFTDEPNQPGGQSAFSVFYLNDQNGEALAHVALHGRHRNLHLFKLHRRNARPAPRDRRHTELLRHPLHQHQGVHGRTSAPRHHHHTLSRRPRTG